jgi:hypothetical protein
LINIEVLEGKQESEFHTATRLWGYGVEDGEAVVGFRAEGPNFTLLQTIQTDSGGYPLSYSMGTWGFFQEVKAAGP